MDVPTDAVALQEARDAGEIPGGWRPTLKEPVPVMRCTAPANGTGERCRQWSIRGATLCVKHGGQLPTVKEHARAVVEASRMRLFGLSDGAVDVLEALFEPGTADGIRLKAATEVLDRAGIRGGQDNTLNVEVTHREDPTVVVRQRLEQIASRRTQVPASEDIVDGEIVEDDPDQDTLFDM